MATSPSRNELLRSRLGRLAAAAKRLSKGDSQGVPPLRDAIWRVRELLPILQLPPGTVRKLDARLRRTARRFAKLRELDALLSLVDELSAPDRKVGPAETRIVNDLRRRRMKLGAEAPLKKGVHDLRRLLEELEAVRGSLRELPDSSATTRAMRWAVKARVTRRAAALKEALDGAGAVYVPGRLRPLRGTTRKLLFGADLLADTSSPVAAADLRATVQMRDALDRLRDTEMLIRRIRQMQTSLTPPDVKTWQELDGIVLQLENRCRRLHARYLRDRASVAAVCDRLSVRAAAHVGAGRKAS